MKNLDLEFSESNQTMTESPVREEMIALASVEDCPDDIGGILEVIDAASDSSGLLSFTNDLGMIDDPATLPPAPQVLRCSTNRCLTWLLNAFVPHQDQVRIGTVATERILVGRA